jgi:hypothetical protein
MPGFNKPDEGTLNQLGYMLLRQQKTDDAIKIFERNVQDILTRQTPMTAWAKPT